MTRKPRTGNEAEGKSHRERLIKRTPKGDVIVRTLQECREIGRNDLLLEKQILFKANRMWWNQLGAIAKYYDASQVGVLAPNRNGESFTRTGLLGGNASIIGGSANDNLIGPVIAGSLYGKVIAVVKSLLNTLETPRFAFTGIL